MFSIMFNWHQLSFKTNFQLIHGTKHCKNIQLQSSELSCKISLLKIHFDNKESYDTVFNPMFYKKVQGQKHPNRWAVAESKLPSFRKPKPLVQNG